MKGRKKKKILPIYHGCYQLGKQFGRAPYSGLANINNSFISLVERTQLFESVPVTILLFNLSIFIFQTRAIKRWL